MGDWGSGCRDGWIAHLGVVAHHGFSRPPLRLSWSARRLPKRVVLRQTGVAVSQRLGPAQLVRVAQLQMQNQTQDPEADDERGGAQCSGTSPMSVCFASCELLWRPGGEH